MDCPTTGAKCFKLFAKKLKQTSAKVLKKELCTARLAILCRSRSTPQAMAVTQTSRCPF